MRAEDAETLVGRGARRSAEIDFVSRHGLAHEKREADASEGVSQGYGCGPWSPTNSWSSA
jgi:hypothetical protein